LIVVTVVFFGLTIGSLALTEKKGTEKKNKALSSNLLEYEGGKTQDPIYAKES